VRDTAAVVDSVAPVVTVMVVDGSDGATLVSVPVEAVKEARAELSTLSALVVAGAVVVEVPAAAEFETPAARVVDPVEVRDARAELKTLNALVVPAVVEADETGTTTTPVPDVACDAPPEATDVALVSPEETAGVALPVTIEPLLSVRVMVAAIAWPVNAGSVMLVM
jgi:hypothetical protein